MNRLVVVVFTFVLWLAELSGARGAGEAPLLLVSLDGFRWDYLDKYPDAAPTLRRLRSEGVSARALIPVFPSNTFPNHYTIVTGLRPARHGMLNNTHFDPERGVYFRHTVKAAVRDPRWWAGEPIWVTAIQQGKRAAASFWVGSEAPVKGVQPTWWKPYEMNVPFAARRDEIVDWLTKPEDQRPSVVVVYFEETNAVGHAAGPESQAIRHAIQELDTKVADLLKRLSASGVTPNLVVVSDHGMTETRPDACVYLDDYVDVAKVQLDFTGPVAGLRPIEGTVDDWMKRLQKLPAGARAYRAEELPAEFHLSGNPRIPPIWVLAGRGGWAELRATAEAKFTKTRGEHGYDPRLPDMQGILIAHGPAFKTGGEQVDAVENIHLYNLFCAVLGLKPAPNDGDDRLLQLLRR